MNQAGLRLTGYPEDEIRKIDITQVVSPEYLAVIRTMLAHILAGEDPATFVIEIMAKEGQRVPLEVSSQVIVRGGKAVGFQGIGRNITRRRQAEEKNHRRAILMGRLIGLTEALNQPLSEGEAVKAIGRGALRLSEAGRGALLVRQPDGTVACPWSQGISRTSIAEVIAHLHELPAGSLMTRAIEDVVELPGGSVVRGMKPVLFPDLDAAPSETVSRLAREEGYRAAGVWPLTSEGRVIALMGCYYDAPRTWSKPELDALRVFFRQAAVALENARLHEARAQRTEELESLLALSTRLRAAYSLEEMYPLLVEHARQVLRAAYGPSRCWTSPGRRLRGSTIRAGS